MSNKKPARKNLTTNVIPMTPPVTPEKAAPVVPPAPAIPQTPAAPQQPEQRLPTIDEVVANMSKLFNTKNRQNLEIMDVLYGIQTSFNAIANERDQYRQLAINMETELNAFRAGKK